MAQVRLFPVPGRQLQIGDREGRNLVGQLTIGVFAQIFVGVDTRQLGDSGPAGADVAVGIGQSPSPTGADCAIPL